jgi:hypothetical protein
VVGVGAAVSLLIPRIRPIEERPAEEAELALETG